MMNEDVEGNTSYELTNNGKWTAARYGKPIQCRLWRVLDGNHQFLCDGRIILGPGRIWWFAWIIILILVTSMSFIYFELLPYNESLVITGVTAYLAITISINLIQVAVTEPGYIPRPHPEERLNNLIAYHSVKRSKKKWRKMMLVNGKKVCYSFCTQCCQFCPPRSGHCKTCDSCVERIDHHCFMFGTCIGRRNHGPFLRFLLLSNILLGLISYFSTRNFIQILLKEGFKRATMESPTLLLLMSALFLPPLGLIELITLFWLHFYLSLQDRTVYEKKNGLRKCLTSKSHMTTLIFQGLKNYIQLAFFPPPSSHVYSKLRSYVKVRALAKDEPIKTKNAEDKSKKCRSMALSCLNPKEYSLSKCQSGKVTKMKKKSYLGRPLLYDSRLGHVQKFAHGPQTNLSLNNQSDNFHQDQFPPQSCSTNSIDISESLQVPEESQQVYSLTTTCTEPLPSILKG